MVLPENASLAESADTSSKSVPSDYAEKRGTVGLRRWICPKNWEM
jgi:hypothetical protein